MSHAAQSPGERADSAAHDRSLWFGVQGGDAHAFESLFMKHAAGLSDFAAALLVDDDAAQEIVQTLFCWIWEHRHTLEVPNVVRAYLFVAVRNRCRNHQRHARVSAAFMERVGQAQAVTTTTVPPDLRVEARDFESAMMRALTELPPRCREVFEMTRYQSMPQKEVALTLGIAPKTVEIHLGRALKLLRVKLAPWLKS